MLHRVTKIFAATSYHLIGPNFLPSVLEIAKTSRHPRTLRMKIGLVSDTHLPRFGNDLPTVLKQGLIAQRVELILHLGDFTSLAVADLFRRIAPFDAVAGNNDPNEICRSFGRRKILAVAGLGIGMIHGDGTRKTTLARALDAFAGDKVDVILFGHSHNPYCKLHGDVWLINPGSPTDKRRNRSYSYAVLEIVNGRANPTLHTTTTTSVRTSEAAAPGPA
jgi:putative phosphoesterase